MRKAGIIINAYCKPVNVLFQAERLKQELKKVGFEADIIKNRYFLCQINDGGSIDCKADDYEFVIYLDKDKYIARMLEKSGLRLFNNFDAIEKCDDKMTTAICLSGSGIPMPETLPGLLCYTPGEAVPEESLRIVAEKLGFPLIAKACYGSMGKEVYMVNDFAALRATAEELKCRPHLYQKFIAGSRGKDIRLIVIGGRCVAAMIRQSKSDYRSNIELGGVGIPVNPPKAVVKMAEKAAEILNLDYCGVDVLFDENGYYLCEVNSNAFFKGIEQATGINVAEKYVRHIISVTDANKR